METHPPLLDGLDEGGDEGLHFGGDVGVGGVGLDLFDDDGADDDAVAMGGDGGGLLGGVDAEADADGDLGVLFDPGDGFADRVGGGSVGACDAGAGESVNKPFRLFSEKLYAICRSGRGNEGDDAQAMGGGHFRMLCGFVGWEVEREDAVDSGGGGGGVEFVPAVGNDGVEVGVEDDGGFVRFPEIADEVEDLDGGGAGFEGTVGGELVDDAVSERVGKGEAEFDDVGAGVGEGFDDLEGARHVGVSGGDVGDKGFLPLGLEAGKCGVDAVAHELQRFRSELTR